MAPITAPTLEIEPTVSTSGDKDLPPPTIAAARQHAPELDTLRAVAIFSVLFSHFLPPSSIFNRIQHGSALGVPLFFALSGFLITRILVQSRATIETGYTTRTHSLYIFYARRFLRIFPLYYAVLFLGTLLKFTGMRAALPWHLAYLSNFYYVHRGAFDKGPSPVFWTLSVEEQFYLIWPLVFLLIPLRWLARFTIMVAVAGGLFAAWASPKGPVFNTLLPAHLIYLSLGGYLGLAGVAPLGSPAKLQRTMSLFLGALFVVVILAVGIDLMLPQIRGKLEIENGCRYTATALVFAWIIARLSQPVGGLIGKVLRWEPLTYVGKISYGIYILQFFVTTMMERAEPKVSALIGIQKCSWLLESFPARVAAVIIVASISFRAYEKPVNDLKRFFPYSIKRKPLHSPVSGV